MRVLVTGYGGFLGAAICRQLLSAGFQVRGLARTHYPELKQLGVETVQGDIGSMDTCRSACHQCDALIHTAAKAGVWGRWSDYYRINTLATQNLIQAASEVAMQALVYTSSPSVTFDGRPQSAVDESAPYPKKWLCYYPQTKALAEQAVAQAAAGGRIQACSLRPHLIWGQGDPHLFPRVIQRALSGKLRRVGSGKNLIDIVHVEHAAQAHLLALQRLLSDPQRLNGQSLFITDGQPIECWQWISKILQAADLKIPESTISYAAAYRIGAVLELLYRSTGRQSEPPMTRFVAAQLSLDHYFSIQRAQDLLGYQPSLDRDTELSRCAPWLRSLV